jgi:FkbM family methyltransferase
MPSYPRVMPQLRFYSQHYQDQFVYENFFKNCSESGVFVEVGAYDGITLSNTLFFEQHLGWTGLCIEPLPDAFAKLKVSRRVPCVNCAVSDMVGTATFLDVALPNVEKTWSGLKANYDARHMQTVRKENGIIRHIRVEVQPLGGLLDAHRISQIDYLSIDTEGSEWKIIRNFDFRKYDVRIISIENNYKDEKIRKHLINAGYRLVRTFGGYDELYAKLNSK